MAAGRSSTANSGSRTARRLNLTRAERADLVRRRLFDSAVKVVGQHGYAEATVARITKLSGVAQGTFYNHFSSRQDLLDQLLPVIGQQMLEFIRTRVAGIADPAILEVARFRAFFDFLLETPQFMRILNEAQLFAPAGYAKHMETVSKNYMRALRRDGVADGLSDKELEVVTQVLMGARSYLSQRFSYTNNTVHAPDEAVFTAYEKLVRHGLFGG